LFPDPAGPQFNGQFGFSEALSADYRIAGSPLVDTLGGNDSGQVYIYSAATNNLLWTLDNPTPAAMDRFGISVSISGNYLAVGADSDDAGVADAGIAYVYDLTSGTPTTPVFTLNNPSPTASDRYGFNVAISGNYVAVGAYQDDQSATDSGSVYVFDLGSATPTVPFASIANPTPFPTDFFGYTVALSGKYMVAGAYQDDNGAMNAGSAYAYDVSSATPSFVIATFSNPTPAATDNYGKAVAVSGTLVAIGADLDDTGASNAGSAYVYDLGSGVPTIPIATLNNPSAGSGDSFGGTVSVNGIYVVVGVPLDDAGFTDAGSAYVYDMTSGTKTIPVYTLNHPTPAQSDVFGSAVAVLGTIVAVNASSDDVGAPNAGSVFVYDLISGTPTTPIASLANPTKASFEQFGVAAISGKYVAVGATDNTETTFSSGSVYVFDMTAADPTVPVWYIPNPAPAGGDIFGGAVAISGNYLVVGAYFDDLGANNSGTAYVYDLSSATPTVPLYTLPNPTPASGDLFGFTLAISGSLIIVGAPSDDTGAVDTGSAYVYDLNSATPTVPIVTLNNPTPAVNDQYGSAVAISGKKAVVGAPADDVGATDAGFAYVYDVTSATPTVPIVNISNPSPFDGDSFGLVSISGKYVVVGAIFDDTGGTDAGSAYVYDITSGTPTVPIYTLNNPEPAGGDEFGLGIATSGNLILIGAFLDNAGAIDSGTAYLYDLASATPTLPVDTINNPTPFTNEQFARYVGIDGNRVVIGSFRDSTQNYLQGAAYVYGVAKSAKVSSVSINDGMPQRSRVTSLTVTFDSPVTLPGNPANAFQLVRQGTLAPVTLSAAQAANSVTLSFTGGSVDNISLADGFYTLTILKSQINGGNFDSTGSSVPGDNYVLIGDTTNKLFRLFGDADGNATVNSTDFAVFRSFFGLGASMFDFNNDFQTNSTDFAEFRKRFGVTLMP